MTAGLGKDRVAADVEVGGMNGAVEGWNRESPLVLAVSIDLYTRSQWYLMGVGVGFSPINRL